MDAIELKDGEPAAGASASGRRASAASLRSVALIILLRLCVILGASGFIFFGTAVLPGDFATELLGQEYSEEVAANIREELGLEKPLVERYARWLTHSLMGDLGTSYVSRSDVWSVVEPRLLCTLLLASMTIGLWFPISVVVGVAAFLARPKLRRAFMFVSQVLVCTPEFFIAYLLIYLFAVELQILPAISRFSWQEPFFQITQKLLLPSACIGIGMVAYVGRMILSLLQIEERKDYFEYALLRGFSRFLIVIKHALVALVPSIVNLFFIYCAYLFTGVLVVEVIFGIAGLGDLIVSSVTWRDMPVVQFCALLITTIYVTLYALSDLISARANARLEF